VITSSLPHLTFSFPFLSFFVFVQPTPSKPFKKIDLSSHHALETGHVALLGGDLEVAVDNTVIVVSMGT
jgi:hypothetical protein